jgi:hypothetical protein
VRRRAARPQSARSRPRATRYQGSRQASGRPRSRVPRKPRSSMVCAHLATALPPARQVTTSQRSHYQRQSRAPTPMIGPEAISSQTTPFGAHAAATAAARGARRPKRNSPARHSRPATRLRLRQSGSLCPGVVLVLGHRSVVAGFDPDASCSEIGPLIDHPVYGVTALFHRRGWRSPAMTTLGRMRSSAGTRTGLEPACGSSPLRSSGARSSWRLLAWRRDRGASGRPDG